VFEGIFIKLILNKIDFEIYLWLNVVITETKLIKFNL